MTGQECRHWWHSPLGWTFSLLLALYVLFMHSYFVTERDQNWETIYKSLQEIDEAVAMWKEEMIIFHKLDEIPERRKWVTPLFKP